MNNIAQPIISDNIYLLVAPEKEAESQILKLSKTEDWQMASIQGEKFPDTNGFFETLKDIFQTPDYCSGGWNSFWEYIGEDLNTLTPAKGYVFYISHADQLFKNSDPNFDTFIDVFEDAARVWSRQNIPFKVFLHVNPENEDVARRRLREADEKAEKERQRLRAAEAQPASRRIAISILVIMLAIYILSFLRNYL